MQPFFNLQNSTLTVHLLRVCPIKNIVCDICYFRIIVVIVIAFLVFLKICLVKRKTTVPT